MKADAAVVAPGGVVDGDCDDSGGEGDDVTADPEDGVDFPTMSSPISTDTSGHSRTLACCTVGEAVVVVVVDQNRRPPEVLIQYPTSTDFRYFPSQRCMHLSRHCTVVS